MISKFCKILKFINNKINSSSTSQTDPVALFSEGLSKYCEILYCRHDGALLWKDSLLGTNICQNIENHEYFSAYAFCTLLVEIGKCSIFSCSMESYIPCKISLEYHSCNLENVQGCATISLMRVLIRQRSN